MSVGIVALSFAKRAVEPNPVNIKLAEVADNFDEQAFQDDNPALMIAQWEVALALPYAAHLVVNQEDATKKDRNGKPYLDSEDVLEKAFIEFRKYGITDVIVVANPFLHLQAAQAIVKKAGFTVVKYKVPWVGFDNDQRSLQWWCKGPIRFIAYLAIQVVGKLTKQDFHGIWEKPHPH